MLKVEWTNRDTLVCSNITCANCQYNDGVIYTSIPPQYKCTITNEFHHNNDKCDVEFAPIKHGHWIEIEYGLICSECNHYTDAMYDEPFNNELGKGWALKRPYYCGYCGAKMDEVEDETN